MNYVSRVPVQKARFWQDKQALLGRLDIELTERCNNNCAHCYINLAAGDEAARGRETSTTFLQDTLLQATSLGCLSVRFTGGEPLLRPDFEQMYLFARRLGLKVLLFTNATLLTPYLADLLQRVPPLERIEVSVYGMSRRSYEATSRVPGTFAAAQRGIALLRERNIPFVVKGAMLPANKGEIDAFGDWAASLPGMDSAPSYAMFFDLRCRRDSEQKNAAIRRLRLAPEEGLAVMTRRPERYRKDMAEFCGKFLAVPGDNLFTCGSGVGGACLDAYGALQPCMMLRHPDTMYDLAHGSLKDALERFFPAVRQTKATNPDYLRRCARCFIKSLCEQCPAKSWMEHGTLDTPVDYLCAVAHIQARWLGLLGDGDMAWDVADWKLRVERLVASAVA